MMICGAVPKVSVATLTNQKLIHITGGLVKELWESAIEYLEKNLQ